MSDEIHDHSRIDAFMAARRRAMLLHAAWRPMLAGAAGAALVIACVWVTLPKVSYREIEVPRMTLRDVTVPNIVARDVTVDHVIPKDVEIDIPHIATAPVAASQSHEEQKFTESEGWRSSIIRGRILRKESPNGFVLATDAGELSFFPARLGPDARPASNPGMRDAVESFLGDLGYCSPLPAGAYHCVALHASVETEIPQVPIGRGVVRPSAGGKPTVAPLEILVRPQSVEANRNSVDDRQNHQPATPPRPRRRLSRTDRWRSR
jgi:hypothetical protein